ncbi:hypothetical protein D3C86_1927110 [compost metagenome]
MLHVLRRDVVAIDFLNNRVIFVDAVVHPAFIGGRVCTHQQEGTVRCARFLNIGLPVVGRIVIPAVLAVVEDKPGNIAGKSLERSGTVALFHGPVGPCGRILCNVRPLHEVREAVILVISRQ